HGDGQLRGVAHVRGHRPREPRLVLGGEPPQRQGAHVAHQPPPQLRREYARRLESHRRGDDAEHRVRGRAGRAESEPGCGRGEVGLGAHEGVQDRDEQAEEQSLQDGLRRGEQPQAGQQSRLRPQAVQPADHAGTPSWAAHIRAYGPPAASSSSWRPRSTSRPPSSTRIWSAPAIVCSRWAITITVLPTAKAASASWTAASLSASSAAVASSRTTIGAPDRMARAIVSRWRSPPDRPPPLASSTVSYPSGRRSITSWTHAAAAARRTSSSPAPGRPMRMFSATLSRSSATSWNTSDIIASSRRDGIERTSAPPIRTAPPVTS